MKNVDHSLPCMHQAPAAPKINSTKLAWKPKSLAASGMSLQEQGAGQQRTAYDGQHCRDYNSCSGEAGTMAQWENLRHGCKGNP